MVSLKTWLLNWRSILNWNYVRDRANFNFVYSALRKSIFELKHPFYPWITIEMVNILENVLKKSDVGFEFGSGYSTIWFAKNTAKITSIEHDDGWFKKVTFMLKKQNLEHKSKVIEISGVDEIKMTGVDNYIRPIYEIKDCSLDYCFIDGIFRDSCLVVAIPKLKHGGILIMDNVDNYFPKNKTSISVRYKRDNRSKLISRSNMKQVNKILSGWRCIWTSSAVQDTALWIKP